MKSKELNKSLEATKNLIAKDFKYLSFISNQNISPEVASHYLQYHVLKINAEEDKEEDKENEEDSKISEDKLSVNN